MKALRRTLHASAGILLAATLLPATPASAGGQAIPDGFDDYLVLVAAGTVPFEPHPNTEITGCSGIFCDGQYFHEVIMGRSQAEIDMEEQRAKEFMEDRFGLIVDDLVDAGRLAFQSFFLDPRGEYRAYSVADAKVRSEGWVVRDGGFLAIVEDPAGIELGGDFAGLDLPPIPLGGIVLTGNYNIQTTNPEGFPKGEIIVSYRSGMPMVANAWGEFVINCQISLDDFADGENSGKAQGMALVLPAPEGAGLAMSWRNVLTIGGLIPEPPFLE